MTDDLIYTERVSASKNEWLFIVPWNALICARHGWVVLEPAALTPGLVGLPQGEQSRGLRTDLRVIKRYNGCR